MTDKELKKIGREHLRQIREGASKTCKDCGFMMFWKPIGRYFECEVCDNLQKKLLPDGRGGVVV